MSVQDHRTGQEVFIPKNRAEEAKLPKINFDEYSHIRVVNNRVMVREVKIDYNKSAGGILTSAPTQKKKEFTQGVVVAVGEGYVNSDGTHVPTRYTVGDVVYFGDMAGIDFKIRRENHEFEEIKVVDVASIYFVDGAAADLYENTTPVAAQ